jgi:hypothetical protein
MNLTLTLVILASAAIMARVVFWLVAHALPTLRAWWPA